MKTNFFFVTLTTLILVNQNLFADSPLTSTAISEAYQDEKIVQIAASSDGILTFELMNYLANNNNPIDLKIAVINELGWSIDGKNNSEKFLYYLEGRYNLRDINDFFNQVSGDILICMAYLKALDNYFDVNDAIIWARRARSKKPESYTVNIIGALIEAQEDMSFDWCDPFLLDRNNGFKIDMRKNAIDIIFEYMGCN